MSTQHRGTFQYWKPNRRWTYEQWSRRAWFIALTLIILAFGYAAVATVIMLASLPPEIPR